MLLLSVLLRGLETAVGYIKVQNDKGELSSLLVVEYIFPTTNKYN